METLFIHPFLLTFAVKSKGHIRYDIRRELSQNLSNFQNRRARYGLIGCFNEFIADGIYDVEHQFHFSRRKHWRQFITTISPVLTFQCQLSIRIWNFFSLVEEKEKKIEKINIEKISLPNLLIVDHPSYCSKSLCHETMKNLVWKCLSIRRYPAPWV